MVVTTEVVGYGGWEVHRSESGCVPLRGLVFSDVESSVSAARHLVTEYVTEYICQVILNVSNRVMYYQAEELDDHSNL
jgi:glyoxylate carboligase